MQASKYRGYRFVLGDVDDGNACKITFSDFPSIVTVDATVSGAWEKASRALDSHLEKLHAIGIAAPVPSTSK